MAETVALWEGENERERLALWQTRRIAGLLRNAHFANPQPEHVFMPLPGDEELNLPQPHNNEPEEAFYLFAQAMGGEITRELNAA